MWLLKVHGAACMHEFVHSCMHEFMNACMHGFMGMVTVDLNCRGIEGLAALANKNEIQLYVHILNINGVHCSMV
jgi:hypothetical protein